MEKVDYISLARAVYIATDGFYSYNGQSSANPTTGWVRRILDDNKIETDFGFPINDRADFLKYCLERKENGNSFEESCASCWLDEHNELKKEIPYKAVGLASRILYNFYKNRRESKGLKPIPEEIGTTVSIEGNMTLKFKGENRWGSYYQYFLTNGLIGVVWRSSKLYQDGKVRITGIIKGTQVIDEDVCSLIGGKVLVEPI